MSIDTVIASSRRELAAKKRFIFGPFMLVPLSNPCTIFEWILMSSTKAVKKPVIPMMR